MWDQKDTSGHTHSEVLWDQLKLPSGFMQRSEALMACRSRKAARAIKRGDAVERMQGGDVPVLPNLSSQLSCLFPGWPSRASPWREQRLTGCARRSCTPSRSTKWNEEKQNVPVGPVHVLGLCERLFQHAFIVRLGGREQSLVVSGPIGVHPLDCASASAPEFYSSHVRSSFVSTPAPPRAARACGIEGVAGTQRYTHSPGLRARPPRQAGEGAVPSVTGVQTSLEPSADLAGPSESVPRLNERCAARRCG